jgi:hypothetical protein
LDGGAIGPWIRPISVRAGHGVGDHERFYPDRTPVQVLDIAHVSLARHTPSHHQPENFVLDGNGKWRRCGVATWTQLYQSSDPHDEPFWRDYGSTMGGHADKMSPADALAIGSSLKLIMVRQLQISVRTEHGYNGNPPKKKVRARFAYEGTDYVLTVTDPVIDEIYRAYDDGRYSIGIAFLCVSLSEVFDRTGDIYRLVAAIITPRRCETHA